MRTVAIIQARLGSQRLPRKVLAPIVGSSMLAHVVARVRAASVIDEVVVATTTSPIDDAIVTEADRIDVAVERGSEQDVLARYVQAARVHRADAVVRVTADCPLLVPSVIVDVVRALDNTVDYASNVHVRTYPRGLDVEVMHHDTLERIARMALSESAREHVTSFIREEPALFRTRDVCGARDDSDLRWTVDTPEDLELARALYRYPIPYDDLVALVRRTPELLTLNRHVVQKPWSNRNAH